MSEYLDPVRQQSNTFPSPVHYVFVAPQFPPLPQSSFGLNGQTN